MNIRQLVTFVRVADLGSFAAAAKALNSTPSTVSTRIRELESAWGVELFDRGHHRLQIRPKGEEILPWARQMVALSDRIGYQLGEPEAFTGLLRVGVAGRVAHTWLPQLVAAVRAQHPRVRFDLQLGLTAPLLQRVRSGELDLAFAGGPIRDPALDFVSLGHDEFVWMGSPSLVGLPRAPLMPEELARWPLVGLSQDSPHYPVIDQWFKAAGVDYRPAISCNDMAVAARLIGVGLGIGLLHRASHQGAVLAGQLAELDTAPPFPRLEFVAVYPRSGASPLTLAVAKLASEISEFPRGA